MAEAPIFAFKNISIAFGEKRLFSGIEANVNKGDRISLIGACAYAFIALVPILLEKIFNINVSFGGTTLLIVTGVALEIVKQLEAQMLMRHYKGFLS